MNKIIVDKRQIPRVTATFPIKITPEFLGHTVDLNETGLRFILDKPLLLSEAQAKIEFSPEESIETEFKVIWNKHLVEKGRFTYGVCFVRLEEKDMDTLRKIVKKITIDKIEEFFGIALPEHIKKKYEDKQIHQRLTQVQIRGVIDFAPPFLKIDKLIVFDISKDLSPQSTSLGIGIITLKDTAGHYNNTIFLAMCGWLMASVASVHLAVLFPSKAPQVVEANKVKPMPDLYNSGLLKPSSKGTTFLVETNIIRKKLQLVLMRTDITFGTIHYGTIEELKLFLMKRESILGAKEIPDIVR